MKRIGGRIKASIQNLKYLLLKRAREEGEGRPEVPITKMTDQEANPNLKGKLNASIVIRKGITSMNTENERKDQVKTRVGDKKKDNSGKG